MASEYCFFFSMREVLELISVCYFLRESYSLMVRSVLGLDLDFLLKSKQSKGGISFYLPLQSFMFYYYF